MILRRFTKHITEQNWFAVGLDVIVVILGVYIGIYLGEASSERAIQQDVQEAVSVIKTQLEFDLENLDRIADYRTQKLEQPRKALALLSQKELDQIAFSNAIFESYRRVYTLFTKSSGYSGIKDTGYLSKINSTELQHTLANLYDSIYVRLNVINSESDDTVWDYSRTYILMYWSATDNTFIGDPDIARARLQNALERSLSNSAWYAEFLSQTVRPAIVDTLAAIKEYQTKEK